MSTDAITDGMVWLQACVQVLVLNDIEIRKASITDNSVTILVSHEPTALLTTDTPIIESDKYSHIDLQYCRIGWLTECAGHAKDHTNANPNHTPDTGEETTGQ